MNMKKDFNEYFPESLSKVGYKNNKEYLDENIKRTKMMIEYFANREPELNNQEDYKREVLENFLLADFYILSRLQNTKNDVFIPAHHLKNQFNLNDLEWTCLLISIIFYSDTEYKSILLKIAHFYNQKELTYELIAKIFYFTDNIYEQENMYSDLINLKFKMSSLCFNRESLKLDENIFYFIMYGNSKLSLNGVEIYLPDFKNPNVLPIRENLAQKIKNISKLNTPNEQFCFYLHGENGIGKKTLAKRSAELMHKGTIIIDLKLYVSLDKQNFYKLIHTPLRQALILNSVICLDNFEVFNEMTSQKYEYLEFLLINIPMFSIEIFILSNNEKISIPNINKSLAWIDIPLEGLSYKERLSMWDKSISDIDYITNINPKEMADKFNFNPAQINSTINSAKSLWYLKGCKMLNVRDLCKCAYSQSISNISNKASLIKTTHTWSELILDDKEKNMIRDACNQIKYKNIVYEKWGMNSRVLYGRGLSMLFAGPPGTGKTMAAQVVANELGLEIYKADISKIISKYIGETEKNLNDLFNEAKKSNVILFFDETDALLGKRTEIKDSHDKNANVETSYLLQKMEEYDGITIMTTNYLENIDKAFFRRISYVIHFAFPNATLRKKIWTNMFPPQMPLSKNIDFKYLAENFEISGGNIKNIAINAAFMAAGSSKQVGMEHIIKSAIYELKKQGKTLIEDDLGEYAYMMEGK